jgi:hypothetical protein
VGDGFFNEVLSDISGDGMFFPVSSANIGDRLVLGTFSDMKVDLILLEVAG